MKNKDVQVGMKVVPHRKTAWFSLSESQVWKDAIIQNQPYLFVNGYDTDEKAWMLGRLSGEDILENDFFKSSDFWPYVP